MKPLLYSPTVNWKQSLNSSLIWSNITIGFPIITIVQLEGFTIGSGTVESGIKQIGRRIKISGAQWDAKNVDQVVKHRCAYLNGRFSARLAHSQTL